MPAMPRPCVPVNPPLNSMVDATAVSHPTDADAVSVPNR